MYSQNAEKEKIADNFKTEIVFAHSILKFYLTNEHTDDKNSKIFRTKSCYILVCIWNDENAHTIILVIF